VQFKIGTYLLGTNSVILMT